MYRGIIQHRGFITEYLRDHILSNGLEQPIARGRIYRIVHDTTKRDQRPSMSTATSAALVQMLSHPNGWRRDTAQRLLVEREDASVVPALIKLAGSAPDARTRLHALWTLDGMDKLTPEQVKGALKDASRDVRTSALRLSERWVSAGDQPMIDAVLALKAIRDWSYAASSPRRPVRSRETGRQSSRACSRPAGPIRSSSTRRSAVSLETKSRCSTGWSPPPRARRRARRPPPCSPQRSFVGRTTPQCSTCSKPSPTRRGLSGSVPR